MHIGNRYSKIVQPSELSEDERQMWAEFWRVSTHQSPFMTYHFSRLVEKCGVFVHVAIIFSGGRIIGFFPYQYSSFTSRLLGRAERVGGEMSDYCGVIAEPGARFSENELLVLAKIRFFDFSHLHFGQLDIGLTASASDSGHLIRISSTGLEYWQELAKKDRRLTQDTQRCIGKFEREVGPLSFDADVRGRSDLLTLIIQKKREQYERTEVSDALGDGWRQKLMELLYLEQAPDCRGMISIIECGPDIVAMHFGLVAGSTLHYWFPVYDSKYAKYSPGRLLYKFLIESMDVVGLRVIDHGAGDAAYKIALSNESYKVYSGRWRQKSPTAFLAIAASSAEGRLRRFLKSNSR
jgi:CelD/BcsL family acetyltransferase involved in cellulose biosynthesis